MKILTRMARNSSPDRYESLVERIRQLYPRLAITTDIIVGFPGERDLEFEESLSFVKSIQYAGGHVFTYSEVPGTAAASFPGQIRHPIRRERNQRMRSAIEDSSIKYRSSFLDSRVSVLWESLIALDAEGLTLNGHSSEGMRIQAHGSASALNQMNNVLIRHLTDGGVLFGSVEQSPFEA
jgi:tRNA A37 methylthiotransferase MiaB